VSDLLIRSFEAELTERDGREIYGRCVPYGVAADVRDGDGPMYRERFEQGAFAGAVKAPNRVALNYRHSRSLGDQIGTAVSFEDHTDGLYGVFRAYNERDGDKALAMIREGALGGLSVGYVPLNRAKRDGDVTLRTRCHLEHVGLVPAHEAAYAEAEVLAVRSRARLDDFRPRRDPELDDRLRSLGYIG
jgi:Escherichia/Staphylococcus phage prohead protease